MHFTSYGNLKLFFHKAQFEKANINIVTARALLWQVKFLLIPKIALGGNFRKHKKSFKDASQFSFRFCLLIMPLLTRFFSEN